MTWQIISFAETTCERLAHTRFRKWRKPAPCPTCGSRRIIFKPLTVAYNPLYHEIYRSWFCGCKDCAPRGKIRGFHIITPHKDLKEAIRAWNHIATGYPKAKENTE